MSGKGCHVLVSPCSVSPSLSMIRGHQPPSIRMPVPSPQQNERTEQVKRGGVHSLTSGKPSGGQVVLPTLSLRRQVLTNGKHLTGPNVSRQQQPAHLSQDTAATTNKLTRLNPSNHSLKGKTKTMLEENPRVALSYRAWNTVNTAYLHSNQNSSPHCLANLLSYLLIIYQAQNQSIIFLQLKEVKCLLLINRANCFTFF